MRTTISVPKGTFGRAERLRQRLGKTRSELYSDAMREYLLNHDPGEITRRLNELADELNAEYEYIRGAVEEGLRRVQWE
jgi:metal-responsive CopG/Arc/MetJ family transcriptional regulator